VQEPPKKEKLEKAVAGTVKEKRTASAPNKKRNAEEL